MTVHEFLWSVLPNLLIGFPGQRPGGFLLTILITVLAVGLGFLLALCVGSAGASPFRPARMFATAYINIFRGLPLILLVLIVHQFVGGRRFGLSFTPIVSAVIALTLYFSAYMGAVLQAGLNIVPQTIVDSSRMMGASPLQCFIGVRLRYSLRAMFPAIINETITLFKDSSVLLVLGVGELMTVARASLGSDVQNSVYWVPVYLLVGAIYAITALALSRLAARWENNSLQAHQAHRFAIESL